jgi:tetratricopeptide (TPR) repeat protein
VNPYKHLELPFNPKSNETYGIFVGAGISYNSGIPTVPMLTKSILENLPLSKEDTNLFLNHKHPFESFIQIIKSNVSIDNLLDVFTIGKPNHTHRFIAKLAKKGYLKIIITTNFDTLLEQALEDEGVKFKKIFSTQQLEKFRYHEGNLTLLKIHGSIEDTKSLGVILERITTKTNLVAVRNALRKFFFMGSHNSIVFLGYSCSDLFDIGPEVEKSFSSLKQINFIQHANRTIKINSISSMNPFEKYRRGQVVQVNTDILIKYAWKINFSEKYCQFKSRSNKWMSIINKWATTSILKNNQLDGLIICGRLMTFIGYYDLGLKYYKSAFLVAMDNSLIEKLGKIASYSGQVYRHLGDYEKAIKCFDDALKYWKKINPDNYARALSELGSTYRLQGDYKKAIELQRKSLRIFKKTSNFKEIQDCLIILGNVYLDSEKDLLALKYYQKAQYISPKVSNKQSEAILLNSLAAVCIKLNKLPLAIRYLKKALGISLNLGIPRIISAIEFNWGSYYTKKDNIPLAIKKYNIAYKIAKKTDNAYQSYLILKGRKDAYEKIGNYKRVLIDLDLCLTISKNNSSYKKDYKQLLSERKKLIQVMKADL